MRRYLGLVICIFIVATIAKKLGFNTFIDLYSFILVFLGGIGFALLKGRTDNYLMNLVTVRYISVGLGL